jgi:hypothetical protein
MSPDESNLLSQISTQIVDLAHQQGKMQTLIEDVHLKTSEIPIIVKEQEKLKKRLNGAWLGLVVALSVGAYSIFF